MNSLQHIAIWPTGAPGAITNGPESNPTITPYLLPSVAARSVVVVCPGGGYHIKAAHEGEPIALWLNSIGVSAVVLDYRVAPYQHPYPLLDAQRAIRLVRYQANTWGIDPNRVGILGFSAGGHLASTAGTHHDGGNAQATDPVERQSCRPDFMILCYPVITFAGPFTHVGSMQALLGPNPASELRMQLSNETQVTPDTPPTFLWHTAEDTGVPVENSLLFASALSRHRVPFALHVFRPGAHGLGLAADHPEVGAWTNICAAWLRGLGLA